jgi:hypothetical protein
LTAVLRVAGPLPDAGVATRSTDVERRPTPGRLNTIYAQTAADLEWILAGHRPGVDRKPRRS